MAAQTDAKSPSAPAEAPALATEEGEGSLKEVLRDVRALVDDGLAFYGPGRSDNHARFHDLFSLLDVLLDAASGHQRRLAEGAPWWA